MTDSQQKFQFLDPKEISALYHGVKFKIAERNKDGSLRWRCCTCNNFSISTLNNQLIREPKKAQHSNKCLVMLPAQVECYKEYEQFKYKAETLSGFAFGIEYKKSLQQLQEKLNFHDVADFWPKEATAKGTCYAIMTKNKKKEPKTTKKK